MMEKRDRSTVGLMMRSLFCETVSGEIISLLGNS